MKKYLLLLILFVLLLTGCSSDIEYVPKKPDEIENFKKIEATHTVADEDVSAYIIVKGKPFNNQFLYSMTIVMDFEKGERTNRLYNYYQIDYLLTDNTYGVDYHLFDGIDGVQRSYAQNFMPFYNLKGTLSNIKYLVKYSFNMKDENNNNTTYNKQISFSEDIITFGNESDYITENAQFKISMSKEYIDGEKENRYKILLENSNLNKGHMDFQCFIKCSNGEIYPFYGVYHYYLNRGNYFTISDEKLDVKYQVDDVYFQIKTYEENITNTYYIKVKDIK